MPHSPSDGAGGSVAHDRKMKSLSQRYPGLMLEETPRSQSGAGAGTQPTSVLCKDAQNMSQRS